MKNRKEILKMLTELEDRYIYNRGMILYKTTEIRSYIVETEDDIEIVTPENTTNNLKAFVYDIYNEYEWDDEAECIFDEVMFGIDSMLDYYNMIQGDTKWICDENGNDTGERMVNIYDIQSFLSAIDNGITAIADLIEIVEETEETEETE